MLADTFFIVPIDFSCPHVGGWCNNNNKNAAMLMYAPRGIKSNWALDQSRAGGEGPGFHSGIGRVSIFASREWGYRSARGRSGAEKAAT